MLKIQGDLWIVPGYPALYVPSLRYIVVADLHLGFEEEMAQRGIYLPRIQLDKLILMLEELLDMLGSRVEGIIIDGDVKHSFSRLTRQEREEVDELLSFLKHRGLKVEVVRGNHDNYLPIVAGRYGVKIKESIAHLGVMFTHGHKYVEPPGPGGAIVIGHEHPVLVIRDSMGSIIRLPCFLNVPLDTGGRLIVMPAAGPYQSGNPVSMARSQYLSPIIRRHGLVEHAKPYVVDKDIGVLEFPSLGAMADLLEAG